MTQLWNICFFRACLSDNFFTHSSISHCFPPVKVFSFLVPVPSRGSSHRHRPPSASAPSRQANQPTWLPRQGRKKAAAASFVPSPDSLSGRGKEAPKSHFLPPFLSSSFPVCPVFPTPFSHHEWFTIVPTYGAYFIKTFARLVIALQIKCTETRKGNGKWNNVFEENFVSCLLLGVSKTISLYV